MSSFSHVAGPGTGNILLYGTKLTECERSLLHKIVCGKARLSGITLLFCPMKTTSVALSLDILARSKSSPQVCVERSLLLNVLLAQQRSNSPCSLLSMIEWNPWEHVVNDVVFDDAVEDVAANESEFAVDGRKSTLLESPCTLVIVRSVGVSVVKICDHHDPVVHPEVWNAIQQESVEVADLLGDLIQDEGNEKDADVGEKDEGLLASGENIGGGVEMALFECCC